MLRVFRHGLARPVGFVLPMQQWQGKDGPRWISGPWPLRRERLYLLAGDSPLGLRLPLDSLPHIDAANYPYFFPADPFAPREVAFYETDPPDGFNLASSNDVTIDDRGLCYLIDRQRGVDVIETSVL